MKPGRPARSQPSAGQGGCVSYPDTGPVPVRTLTAVESPIGSRQEQIEPEGPSPPRGGGARPPKRPRRAARRQEAVAVTGSVLQLTRDRHGTTTPPPQTWTRPIQEGIAESSCSDWPTVASAPVGCAAEQHRGTGERGRPLPLWLSQIMHN